MSVSKATVIVVMALMTFITLTIGINAAVSNGTVEANQNGYGISSNR